MVNKKLLFCNLTKIPLKKSYKSPGNFILKKYVSILSEILTQIILDIFSNTVLHKFVQWSIHFFFFLKKSFQSKSVKFVREYIALKFCHPVAQMQRGVSIIFGTFELSIQF